MACFSLNSKSWSSVFGPNLISLIMLCLASFFLNGSLGPLLKGLFNAKLYCYFFNYLLFKILNAHTSQIALTMFSDRNQTFVCLLFANNQHIWDLFDFSITNLPPYFLIPEINKPANIGIF